MGPEDDVDGDWSAWEFGDPGDNEFGEGCDCDSCRRERGEGG